MAIEVLIENRMSIRAMPTAIIIVEEQEEPDGRDGQHHLESRRS